MSILRTSLIVFGWMIPFTVMISIGISIFTSFTYASINPNAPQVDAIKIIGILARDISSLAISPLCFFAAHVLKDRGAL